MYAHECVCCSDGQEFILHTCHASDQPEGLCSAYFSTRCAAQPLLTVALRVLFDFALLT